MSSSVNHYSLTNIKLKKQTITITNELCRIMKLARTKRTLSFKDSQKFNSSSIKTLSSFKNKNKIKSTFCNLIKKPSTMHPPHFSDELGPRFLPNPTTTSKKNRTQNQNPNSIWKQDIHDLQSLTQQIFKTKVKKLPAVTNRRLYCIRLWARPRGFFFLSCFATLGVCPLTFPARAKDPWTLPEFKTHTDLSSSCSG